MRNGKISESVLVRSVLKKIQTKREEILCGAGIGNDCAILSFLGEESLVLSTNPVTAPIEEAAVYGIHKAVNNIASAGAEPIGVLLSCLLPQESEEKELQLMMSQAERICQTLQIQIIGGHTEVSKAVNVPVITVTGVGKKKTGREEKPQAVKSGQDVVVSKWIGLEGTVRIAREQKEALLTRYPLHMIEEAEGFERFLSVIPEAATALKSGVCGMHDVSQGGIFAALWELAQKAGVGLEIDLKKLPIRQETIEICEFFDKNPYELLSGGSLLMTTWDGIGLVAALEKEGILAAIVGKTTEGNDRILLNEEEKRFLEPPKEDAFFQIV